MDAVDPKAILDDWLKRFELIENDIQDVLLRRKVFLRLQEIVNQNPRLHRPSYLYDYLADTYAVTNAIAVRRHARHDDQRRDGSLIGLLYAIRRSPELLTRNRHVALYEEVGMPAKLAEAEFDRLAEPGAPHFVSRHVQGDIDDLLGAAAALERYATQTIAHLDRNEPSVIPTFDDLNRAIDVFRRIVLRYRLLLRAVGGDVVPVIAEPWEAVLTEPWIPPRN
jgi:hypothetical protein